MLIKDIEHFITHLYFIKMKYRFKNEYCQYYSKFSCLNYPKCMESHGNLRLKINLPHSMNKVSLL